MKIIIGATLEFWGDSREELKQDSRAVDSSISILGLLSFPFDYEFVYGFCDFCDV